MIRPVDRIVHEHRKVTLLLPIDAPPLHDTRYVSETHIRVEKVIIDAERAPGHGWTTRQVEVEGQHFHNVTGEPIRNARRAFLHSGDRGTYSLIDMPSWLSELVHTEIVGETVG